MVNRRHVVGPVLGALATLLFFAADLPAQRRNLYDTPPGDGPAGQPGSNGGDRPAPPPAFQSGAPYAGGYSGYSPVAPAPVGPSYVPYTPGYSGYPYQQSRYGSYLQGVASVTTATGEYYNQIQQARITREQSRQMALDTQRKQIEQEMWYESIRPTAPRLKAQEKATDLDWARNSAQNTEIWSGRTLNVLLKSVLSTPSPGQGPNISLSETALRGLNLTDGTTRGNLSLSTRDEGKITWPETLQGPSFDEVRDRFGKNFAEASRVATTSGPPSRALMNSLRGDLKKMEEQLEDQVTNESISGYIEARRVLNQVKNNLKGLSDPKLCKSCHANWRKNVRNVSDLVAYCLKNGLEFGPAVGGSESSYTATYYALRNYERGVTRQLTTRAD